MMSDWKVEMVEDNVNEFYVEFKGPRESECRTTASAALHLVLISPASPGLVATVSGAASWEPLSPF